MSDYLDQIEARYRAIRRSVGLGRSLYRGLDAAMASARDVPRLLAAVRAVEQAMDELDEARAIGKVRTYGEIQYRVRHALTEVLEGEG